MFLAISIFLQPPVKYCRTRLEGQKIRQDTIHTYITGTPDGKILLPLLFFQRLLLTPYTNATATSLLSEVNHQPTAI